MKRVFPEKFALSRYSRFDFAYGSAQREEIAIKKPRCEVHRGIKTQQLTASGQQAHFEKVLICGFVPY
jgi:hypothetical protein